MLYKLTRATKGWRKSAFCPYLHWQITLNIFVFFCHLREFWVSFNWFVFLNFIFLHFMPHSFLLDARHCTFYHVGYYCQLLYMLLGFVPWCSMILPRLDFRVCLGGWSSARLGGVSFCVSCPGPHESVWLVETGSVLDPV